MSSVVHQVKIWVSHAPYPKYLHKCRRYICFSLSCERLPLIKCIQFCHNLQSVWFLSLIRTEQMSMNILPNRTESVLMSQLWPFWGAQTFIFIAASKVPGLAEGSLLAEWLEQRDRDTEPHFSDITKMDRAMFKSSDESKFLLGKLEHFGWHCTFTWWIFDHLFDNSGTIHPSISAYPVHGREGAGAWLCVDLKFK